MMYSAFQKKFVALLAATLIFFGLQVQVEAADYYLGEYPDGSVAYLDTSSIRVTTHYSNGCYDGQTYACSVKAVYSNSDQYDRVPYEIYVGQTCSITKNGKRVWHSFRAEDPGYIERNPVEKKLVDYFIQVNKVDSRKVPQQID